jgi:hypothetical protein
MLPGIAVIGSKMAPKEDEPMNKNAAAYYQAGRAVALETLGTAYAALSLADTPSMRPAEARRRVADKSEPAPALPADPEAELLQLLAGGLALFRGCHGKTDPKLGAALEFKMLGIIGALALATSEAEASKRVKAVDDRVKQLVTWRWHAIERIAQALIRKATLTGDEVAALLTA